MIDFDIKYVKIFFLQLYLFQERVETYKYLNEHLFPYTWTYDMKYYLYFGKTKKKANCLEWNDSFYFLYNNKNGAKYQKN